ncbi:unnamed protein product [Cylicocyclus nassatus]|uniref:phosphoenolpyruvate carboxykinase (GTP) n=1 Tax=Cylicocyclus nassatus TaxID=53992 RepID=A0AA36MBF7_CYLNA|nr:unnamed protein product [Cylicocyclus nassatus]
MSERLRHRERVIYCDYCAYPARPRAGEISVTVPVTCNTNFFVEGYGTIPVLNGDPKWLPTKVKLFVGAQAKMMRPTAIHICNGSFGEAEYLFSDLQEKGVFEKLTSYDEVLLARTHPSDAVEGSTYICTKDKEEVEKREQPKTSWAFPRWISPADFKTQVESRFPGCMQGRVMYVIPFSLGPIGGQYSINAVQITDSAYVVLNMRIIARVSSSIWDAIGQSDFVRCVHSIGRPRPVMASAKEIWLCNRDHFFLAHQLDKNEVWAYGSAFGENSFLSKKCVALRLAMYRGYKEGWLALPAALIAVKDPSGKELFGCVSFPIGGGKTEFATMTPTLKDWQVRMLGDDVVWIRCARSGKLHALAPENGLFGCAFNLTSQHHAYLLKMISKNAILTNCASTSKGKYFWETLHSALEKHERVRDWRGEDWTFKQNRLAAHMNCRFTAFTSSSPNVHPDWEVGAGVPISFIIFGCRRSDQMPLIYETESWEHGIVMAAGIRTLSYSALDPPSNTLVPDPLCMRTSMSFSFPKLLNHWISFKEKTRETPKIFMVNLYQEDANGKIMWPGYGDNIRVLEWIFNRCAFPEKASTLSTAIGLLPQKLNTEGLKGEFSSLFTIEKHFWTKEITQIYSFLSAEMGSKMLPVVKTVLENLIKRISTMT